jgi:sodium/hydrogen exchanger-like protein 6/7
MALGISFGLALSLLLKHSYLHYYPSIESCLVALFAYTCYFLSNGLSMSGIVSLLFCGITLKHYAYHTMSRRTQHATEYTFSTLAHLAENFIFIYLGLALFTSGPESEPVFSYFKPLFILITTIAVVFARYVAVFPLSSVINFFHKHARGQRYEELPHSYQMMLFWAGLRGAVGVALAAGFKGPNAQMMRTTVLVVVVLTVVVFGGTTPRMMEILGIRMGVEDDEGTNSDDDEGIPFILNAGPSSSSGYLARSARGRGQWSRYWDEQEGSALSPPGGEFYSPTAAAARVGTHYAARYNHQSQFESSWGTNARTFSAESSESYDSDGGEVLPLAPTALQRDQRQDSNNENNASGSDNNTHPPARTNLSGLAGEDGRWFQNLDERYLLPLFSNATASRTFNARKSAKKGGRRAAAVVAAEGGVGGVGGDGGSVDSRSGTRTNSPLGIMTGPAVVVGGSGGIGVVEGARRTGMATPADSDDEYYGSATGLSQDATNNANGSGSGGSGSGSGSGGGGGGGGENARMALVDDSRLERGLPSPTLRGNAGSPWDGHRD